MIEAIALGVGSPVAYIVGHLLGRRAYEREHRRVLDAGASYIEALNEASAQCTSGMSMQVSLVVEVEPRERQYGKVPLRIVGGGGA